MADGFASRFQILEKLGKGGFASVFKVVSHVDQKPYALKILELPPDMPPDFDVMKEVHIMMALIHPNILKYYKVFQSSYNYGNPVRTGIQVELCETGDLENFINERNGKMFSRERMKRWMLELASAVAYLHEKLIMHRDLKPQNIFVGKNGSLKIGDFGVSRMLISTYANTVIGTALFMAPEALYGKYGFKADVFSLGCVYVCMATLQRVPKNPIGRILDLPPTSVYGETINNVIECCTSNDETERPAAEGILHTLREEDEENRQGITSDDENETNQQRQPVSQSGSGGLTDSAAVPRREPPGRQTTTLLFHNVRGQNMALSSSSVASRDPCTEMHGVVFSNVRIEPETTVTIEMIEVNAGGHVLVSFGFTSVDPETLRHQVPESVHKLEERGDSWIVNRYERLDVGSRVAFHYDVKGNIWSTCKGREKYRRENQVVNTALPVWATFNVSFQIIAVQIIDVARSGSMKLESVLGFPGEKISAFRDNVFTEAVSDPISPTASGPSTGNSHEDVFEEEHPTKTEEEINKGDDAEPISVEPVIPVLPKRMEFGRRPPSDSDSQSSQGWSDDEDEKPKPKPIVQQLQDQGIDSLPPPPTDLRQAPIIKEPQDPPKETVDSDDVDSTGTSVSEELLQIVENEERNQKLQNERVEVQTSDRTSPPCDSVVRTESTRLTFAEKILVSRDIAQEAPKPADAVFPDEDLADFPPPPPLSEDEKHQVAEEEVKEEMPKPRAGPASRIALEDEGDFVRQPSFRSIRAKFEALSKGTKPPNKR